MWSHDPRSAGGGEMKLMGYWLAVSLIFGAGYMLRAWMEDL